MAIEIMQKLSHWIYNSLCQQQQQWNDDGKLYVYLEHNRGESIK